MPIGCRRSSTQLVLNKDGPSLKFMDAVMTAMCEPIFQKRKYVSYVATTRGVEEGSAGAHRAASEAYTMREWFERYETHPLSEKAMEDAIAEWKATFP